MPSSAKSPFQTVGCKCSHFPSSIRLVNQCFITLINLSSEWLLCHRAPFDSLHDHLHLAVCSHRVPLHRNRRIRDRCPTDRRRSSKELSGPPFASPTRRQDLKIQVVPPTLRCISRSPRPLAFIPYPLLFSCFSFFCVYVVFGFFKITESQTSQIYLKKEDRKGTKRIGMKNKRRLSENVEINRIGREMTRWMSYEIEQTDVLLLWSVRRVYEDSVCKSKLPCVLYLLTLSPSEAL